MTLNELYRIAKADGRMEVCRFMRDMRRAGLTSQMRYYRGRWYWKGPGVDCDEIQDVMTKTKIPCQFDNMGKGYIVYPKQSVHVND